MNGNKSADIVLMFVNAGHDPISFRFPQPQRKWHLLLDSAVDETETREVTEDAFSVQGHSVAVFANRVPRSLRPI
jgi:glycogen operon protein